MVSGRGPAAQQLSTLKSLLPRSLQMTQQDDPAGILQLVALAAEAIAGCRTEGILLDGTWQDVGSRGQGLRSADVVRIGRSQGGGPIDVAGVAWGWVYPMPAGQGRAGYLVVGAAGEPSASDCRLLQALARQAGVALANASTRLSERALLAELRAANIALRRSMEIHDRLTQLVMRADGPEGIAQAIHELTGHPAWVEDAFGNVTAWAGGGQPDMRPHGHQERPSRR